MNVGFGQMWEEILIHHVDNTVSNHKALVLNCALTRENCYFRGTRRFHFETMWMKEENFEATVKEAWGSDRGFGIKECIKVCTAHLGHWNIHCFKRVTKEIQCLKSEQSDLNMITPSWDQEDTQQVV